MAENEVIIIDDSIDLHEAPHTVCEISRESFSSIPEKTEEELYAQPEEEGESITSTPQVSPGSLETEGQE